MTKKEEAFALFSGGKTTSNAGVKALKLKDQIMCNYYLEWQKGGGITPSSSPSGEAKEKDEVAETRTIQQLQLLPTMVIILVISWVRLLVKAISHVISQAIFSSKILANVLA